MPEQVDLVELVEDWLDDWLDRKWDNESRSESACRLLASLSAAGCLRKDPDQTLPANPYDYEECDGLQRLGFIEGQESMADRVKVLPLTERKS